MKLKIIRPLALCLLAIGCGPTPQNDVDAATTNLIHAIDNANAKEVRNAIATGARADALASFGNSSLHFASEIGDSELTTQILNQLSLQKSSSSDLANAMTSQNKQSQSALELAARNGNILIVEAFATFCENKRILRSVFFPIAKKLANDSSPGLELVVSALSRFGASKQLMAHLIFETIGTKEGQAILLSHSAELFLADFAQAYLFALDSSAEIQSLFFSVASGFRIEKRAELIDWMTLESGKDLYKNFNRSIEELTAKFGVVKRTPREESPNNSQGNRKDDARSFDDKKLPADQNARLRDAVSRNETDAVHQALENGARIDALDSNLRNVFHTAALSGSFEALTILLSQLQCSNANTVLLQKDVDGSSPFAVAAILSTGKNRSLRAMSEFLLSSPTCQEIAKNEIREWAKAGSDQQIKNALVVFSEVNHGIEVVSDIVYRLLGGSIAQKALGWIEETLCQEARDHVWARIYFQAVTQRDEARTNTMRQVVQEYADVERRQVVGFMLFLSTGHSVKGAREMILGELEHLKLPKAMFEGSSDNIADLKAALDEIVTGQENAKISLSVAIKNHYDRVAKGLKKSNILILGPSGTGKTLLVQTIAKKLDVPFTIFDATNITQAGYVGGKASDAVAALAERGGYNKERIEKGIIFLDEIDKMASRSGRSESDEFKRQGQASLLKMLEGIDVEVQVSRFDKLNIDTSNILFVCAGAFTGLPEIIDARLKTEGLTLGENVFEQAIAADLINYGMAPEFLGRLPNVISLRRLSVEDLVNILKNPKASVLEDYRSIFTARGVEIKFTDGAMQAIAERAVTYNVGARALRTVAESVMSDLQFRIGQMGLLKSITVTERVVKFGDMPTLEYKTDQ